MRIDTDEHGGIELREVYDGVLFVTSEGNRYGVSMRDDTIEVIVNGHAPAPRVYEGEPSDDSL